MDQGAAQHQWGLGFRTFTYEAIALKDGEFTSDDAFVVDLTWYPRPAEPQRAAEPQRDRLRLPYLGGANGTSMIRRVSDSTTDAGVFYEVAPAEEDGRAGRSAVPFNT